MNDRAIAQRTEQDSDHRQRQAAPPRRILVAEDEPVLLNLIANALLQFGYHVDTAEDGLTAWNALQTQRYDLLITDNHMPKVSGADLIRKLRSASMSLPVIMATGALPEEFLRQSSLQAVPMLMKPFSVADLMLAVKRSLGNKTESTATAYSL